MKRILIGAPVHNRAWILPLYLQHLLAIDYPKDKLSIYWIVNNCSDNTLDILRQFKKDHGCQYESVTIHVENSPVKFEDERSNKVRLNHTYDWLSYLRNSVMKKCVKGCFDYLFSCDTDILVEPNIIKELLTEEKDVCAGLIYNGYLYAPDAPWKHPNVLRQSANGGYVHVQSKYIRHPELAPLDFIDEIDATGAVSLISRDVCARTKYTYHVQGEDMSWSLDCQLKGFKLWYKPAVFSRHIMSKNFLEQEENI